MDALVVQYTIISVILIAAVWYLAKRLLPTKGPGKGCAKGCGCEGVVGQK